MLTRSQVELRCKLEIIESAIDGMKAACIGTDGTDGTDDASHTLDASITAVRVAWGKLLIACDVMIGDPAWTRCGTMLERTDRVLSAIDRIRPEWIPGVAAAVALDDLRDTVERLQHIWITTTEPQST